MPPYLPIRRRDRAVTAPAKTDSMKAFQMIPSRRQHVGKWFGQASEIEELRAENANHPSEKVGDKLRDLMSWVKNPLDETA